jgi:TolB protein
MKTRNPTSKFRLSRRGFVVGTGAAMTAASVLPEVAFAQLSGEQREGQIRPIPIAVPEFLSADPKLGADISNVVAADLVNSGLFVAVDRSAFIDRVQNINVAPNFANWRTVGAEALIVGQVSQAPDGRIQVEARVWDVVTGKPLAGNRFATPAQNWRRLSHQVADIAYEKLTGGARYFDTRVVFVDETGPKDKRQKRLAIMDQDGANVRLLSQGRESAITPRFNPVAQEITFVQYQGETSRVMVMNLESGQREAVGNFQGQTFAPRFSPDGQRLVMSMLTGGDTGLLEIDLRSKQVRNLTQGAGINTGPSFAPDGKQIAFESDREGSQQLYVMGTGGIRRLSGGDGRYSTPVWSPRGDYIAFTKQTGGRFLIGVMKPDGSGERILTEGYHNEGPTWAPNGRVLMFFRESQGANGGPKLFSVDITGYNERQVPTPSFGSDPAWSPLLT